MIAITTSNSINVNAVFRRQFMKTSKIRAVNGKKVNPGDVRRLVENHPPFPPFPFGRS